MKPLLNEELFLNFHNIFNNQADFPQSFPLCTNQVSTTCTAGSSGKDFPQMPHNIFHKSGNDILPGKFIKKLVFLNFHSLYYYY